LSQIFKPEAATPPPPGFVETLTALTGTNPVPPNASDTIFIGTALVSARSTPITTVGISGSNTVDIQIQVSTAAASSVVGNVGLSSFNSAFFTVDASGFVSITGTGIGQTITGQTGGALSPTAGNWNIFGTGVTASGVSTAGNLWTSGSGSTLTISPTEAQFMTKYTSVAFAASPYTALATDYYISCISSGGAIEIKLPNAPTTNRLFIIKDNAGDASVNNITITTVGGSVLIDGATSYVIAGNYGAVSLLFNSVGYEVY
jgi:hypothetical protein